MLENKSKKFIQIIQASIKEFNMLAQNDSVLASVSGGSDSIALVLSLKELKDKYNLKKIGIAHLNHNLRSKESLRDQLFVKNFAQKLNLPFYCTKEDTRNYAKKNGLSIEQAGRKLRYDFFKHLSLKHKFTKIATGHTKDDNAELVLMNIFRGSGTKGLAGIPPVRNNMVIRPMIRNSKKQILSFLKAYTQEFVFDSSNMDELYLRNKIRNKMIPYLKKEYNPKIIDSLNKTSDILRIENEYLDLKTKKKFEKCLIKTTDSLVIFSKLKLSKLHTSILNRVVRLAIQKLKTNLKQISFVHIKDIKEFCFKRYSGSSLDLPGQIRVYKKKDLIVFKKEKKPLRQLKMTNFFLNI